MNIYVYSDESGVFDVKHNQIFVFAGVIILGSDSKNTWSRKYANAENVLRETKNYPKNYELKATNISNQDKSKLFRSLNQCYKFAVIIEQDRVLKQIFNSKKDKQRYLDYAYKIAVKRGFQHLIKQNLLLQSDVEHIFFYVDEHTTATNGLYELQEGLEQEFKHGTYNQNYMTYFPPIFSRLKSVKVSYCNSEKNYLVRAADIIANKVYFLSASGQKDKLQSIDNLNLIYLP